MQDLRGPRKIRPGLVLVWPHPSRSEAAYRSRAGHGRGAEIRPNLAAGGWLVEFSLDGEAAARRGGLHGRGRPRRGPGVRGHGTGGQGHPLGGCPRTRKFTIPKNLSPYKPITYICRFWTKIAFSDRLLGWIVQFFAARSTTCGNAIRRNPRSCPGIPGFQVVARQPPREGDP